MSSPALRAFREIPVGRVDLDGVDLAFRTVGSGPPLLMIHGWPLCGATFREHVARMRSHWTCIVPDLPGSGGTPWDTTTQNMLVDWGHLMVKMVDALGLKSLSVLAHDSGGTIARVMAAELGDRVSAMVLGNTELTNHVSKTLVMAQKALRLPGASRVMPWLMSLSAYRRSRFGLGDCFSDHSLLDGDFFDACIAPLTENADGAQLTFTHLDLRTTSNFERIHAALTCPCLLIWGEDDPFFPLTRARQMLGELPKGSELEVIANAKLFVHEEHPAQVVRLAEAFLGRHRAAHPPLQV